MEFDQDSILYHGHGLLAVDKPAGVPVHQGTAHDVGLVELLEEWITLHPGALDVRPGKKIHLVHRLELEASGVLILALKPSVARAAQNALAERIVAKRYLAVVAGPMDETGTVRGKVRSKLRGRYRWVPAELAFRRLRGDERLSLIEVVPHEGRTHQVRALLAGQGRPLAGDLRYGKPKPARLFLERYGLSHLLLHALEAKLPESVIGHELTLAAPIPAAFDELCDAHGWPPVEA